MKTQTRALFRAYLDFVPGMTDEQKRAHAEIMLAHFKHQRELKARRETQSRSWRLIWLNEIEPRLASAGKTEEKQPFQPIAEKEPEKPAIASEPVAETVETDKEPSPSVASVGRSWLPMRSG